MDTHNQTTTYLPYQVTGLQVQPIRIKTEGFPDNRSDLF